MHQVPPKTDRTSTWASAWCANAGRSARNFPFARPVKAASARGRVRRIALRTSAPTSKAAGPIEGPRKASISPIGPATRRRIATTVACRMPAATPRQPACAAATTDPDRSASSTGRQSATVTQQTTPGVIAVDASAAAGLDRIASAATTSAPC